MLLQNISLRLGLVNGSVGEVVGFLHPLELVELVLRAPRERYHVSARGQELLRRGGFPTINDAFRCVDTSLGQSLFWSLRQRGLRQPAEVSYGSVYGNAHCRDVQQLVGISPSTSVHPLELYIGGIPPQQLRLTRLPVVKLDLQPQHLTLRTDKADGANGKRSRSVQLPRHVYAVCVAVLASMVHGRSGRRDTHADPVAASLGHHCAQGTRTDNISRGGCNASVLFSRAGVCCIEPRHTVGEDPSFEL
ncbi:hypothetical protein TcBrA4_0019910 [Trypanosoma cruzi]|nr:hypothetical protein TcBrA4_0019910 [Trypanosoma cruzi]